MRIVIRVHLAEQTLLAIRPRESCCGSPLLWSLLYRFNWNSGFIAHHRCDRMTIESLLGAQLKATAGETVAGQCNCGYLGDIAIVHEASWHVSGIGRAEARSA